MLRRLPPSLRLALAPLCLAGAALAQQGGDLQARILYAFEAEDTNQLASIVQTLDTQVQADPGDESRRYHLAHAEYRLGLLDGAHARDAEAAFTACVDQLKAVLQRHADSAEALALQSACYSNLARYRRIESAFDRVRAVDSLSAAARLAPRNPRVVYREAVDALARAAPGSPASGRALSQLQLAAELFEGSSATGIEAPGWGHAEAYLELGRQLKARGDVVGARNWIEKSLIIAPDFKAAQRELAALVRR